MEGTKKAKQRHLGRGLESLLGPITMGQTPESAAGQVAGIGHNSLVDKELRDSVRHIEVGLIVANPYQPRRRWDDKELVELAESIKVNGLLQPIVVRRAGGKYEVIAGERRLRAARMAGKEKIVALVREASDCEMLELALVENIHRRDLNPIERGQAYSNYMSEFSISQSEAANRLGQDRSVVANYVRLLELPGDVREMVIDGRLSMGQARAILGVATDELRRRLANRALAGRLSVREVERLVRQQLGRDKVKGRAREGKAAHILELERMLSGVLGTRVEIEVRKRGRGGKIVIEFGSLEEFERVTEKMGIKTVEEV